MSSAAFAATVCPHSPDRSFNRHRPKSILLLGGFVLFLLTEAAPAQDIRVVTKVSSQSDQDGAWTPLSRSRTLFHSGKSFDVVEGVGEVVIHEPSESQFVILSLNGNQIATKIRYEQLLQFQKAARVETENYARELKTAEPRANSNVVEALLFQVNPRFEEQFDATTGKIRLVSRFLSYEAETAVEESPGLVDQYLAWADWTARLNSVLHPQAVTPESRLALNEALRKQHRFPTQVDLRVSIDGNSHLRAEHSFETSLHSYDRHSIAAWEKARTSPDLNWVELREYQRILVTASSRRR